MDKSEQINELATALAKAQSKFPAVPKTGRNPYFKTDYVTLDAIIAAIKEPLSQNGIAYTQLISSVENGHALTTMLIHTSGQWISSTSFIETEQNAKNKMQSFGSALTYMKRYALSAILGIASDEDDDGNGSPPRLRQEKRTATEQPPQEKPPATMKELWARWTKLWNEAKTLNLAERIEPLPTDVARDVLIERGKALAAAIEAAKQPRSWSDEIIKAIVEASDQVKHEKHAIARLGLSHLSPSDAPDLAAGWVQQYDAVRADSDSENAAAIANAWLAGEVDDLTEATTASADSRDSAL